MNNPLQLRIGRFAAAVLLGCALIAGNANAEAKPKDNNASAGVSCDGQWHIMPTPNPAIQANDYNSLDGIAVRSTTNVWAVGSFSRFSKPGSSTLAEHWDGSKWTYFLTPHTPLLNNVLASVAAAGKYDVWAVGYQSSASGPYYTLSEHWNGKGWRGGGVKVTGLLSSVAAVARDDIWAVGSTDYVGNGLILHRGKGRWTQTILDDQVYFRAVAAISKNDIWAVGQITNSTGVGDLTYAVHFDGKKWTHVPTPSPFRQHDIDQDWLTSLTAISSNDVWATAVWRDGDFGILDHTFAEHWDGHEWKVVRTLNPGGNSKDHDFWGLAALDSGSVWAVGTTGLDTLQPFAEHWNGADWNVVKTAPITDGSLHAIAGKAPASLLMATGNYFRNGFTQVLAEYACGVR